MLTALELENFKGISERQRIEFRPLTLLFGPNSAGKSTVLQSLLYLHEVIVHGDANVGRTSLGGEAVDLGGFRRLVNGHDASRTMTVRAEFRATGNLDLFQREPEDFPLPDINDQLDVAWLEIEVRWRATAGRAGPVVDRATIGVGNDREPVLWHELTEWGPKRAGAQLPTMSVRHRPKTLPVERWPAREFSGSSRFPRGHKVASRRRSLGLLEFVALGLGSRTEKMPHLR